MLRTLIALLLMAVTIQEKDYKELVRRCRARPGYFQQHVLGNELTPQQLLIRQAVVKHRQTMAFSAHGTGKSNVIGGLIPEFLTAPHIWDPSLRADASVRVVATASTNPQIKDVLWKEVRRLYKRAKFPLGGRMLDREWKLTEERGAVALSVGDPTAMQGKHADAVFVIVDESEGVDRETWEALFSLMTGERSWLLATYNPTKSTGYMAEQARRPDLWHQIQLSGLDHPNVIQGEEIIPGAITRRWIRRAVQREMGIPESMPWEEIHHNLSTGVWDDNPVICARVLGKHPKGSAWQILSIHDLEKHEAGVELESPDLFQHAGLDVAVGGMDQSVVTILDQHRNVIHVEANRDRDTGLIGDWAWAVCQKHGVTNPSCLHIEGDGVGGGVCDALSRKGIYADRVVMGGGPLDDWHGTTSGVVFKNRRAELWWAARQVIKDGASSVAREFNQTRADLVQVDYHQDSKNKIVIEDKKALRKKIGRSTDFGDSFVLSLARPPQTWSEEEL